MYSAMTSSVTFPLEHTKYPRAQRCRPQNSSLNFRQSRRRWCDVFPLMACITRLSAGATNTAYAMNAIYPTLPTGCAQPVVAGKTYYLCGNTWFLPSYGANGVYYRVVPIPRGAGDRRRPPEPLRPEQRARRPARVAIRAIIVVFRATKHVARRLELTREGQAIEPRWQAAALPHQLSICLFWSTW